MSFRASAIPSPDICGPLHYHHVKFFPAMDKTCHHATAPPRSICTETVFVSVISSLAYNIKQDAVGLLCRSMSSLPIRPFFSVQHSANTAFRHSGPTLRAVRFAALLAIDMSAVGCRRKEKSEKTDPRRSFQNTKEYNLVCWRPVVNYEPASSRQVSTDVHRDFSSPRPERNSVSPGKFDVHAQAFDLARRKAGNCNGRGVVNGKLQDNTDSRRERGFLVEGDIRKGTIGVFRQSDLTGSAGKDESAPKRIPLRRKFHWSLLEKVERRSGIDLGASLGVTHAE
jgi:hypothetical protein